jgi:hypothetical protein
LRRKVLRFIFEDSNLIQFYYFISNLINSSHSNCELIFISVDLRKCVKHVRCKLKSSHWWQSRTQLIQVIASSTCSYLVNCFSFVICWVSRCITKMESYVVLTVIVFKLNFWCFWLYLLLVRKETLSLWVWVVWISNCVFMSIQIQIKLVFHQQWQVVIHNMFIVNIPLSPHRVMLHCSFPNNWFILIPFIHHILNPFKLYITPLLWNIITCFIF